MRRAAWNGLALMMFGVAGLWGYALLRTHSVLWLAITFPLLAALSWGFYQRRFASWRTVVGWAYVGLSIGVLIGLGTRPAPLWIAMVSVVFAFMALLMLPSQFNSLFWTVSLWRLRPEGWSSPQPQNRELVLVQSPFTLHEVVKVTDQLSGGVVQTSERKVDRLECRFRGDPLFSESVLADLEAWVLTRYRQYRWLRHLPISTEVTSTREQSREEDQPLELYSSPKWGRAAELGHFAVLDGSPFQVWAEFLQSSAPYQVLYPVENEVSGERQERRFVFQQGHDHDDLTESELDERGYIVEQVTVRLKSTGRVVAVHPDLDSAEADIWKRYSAQRQTRVQES